MFSTARVVVSVALLFLAPLAESDRLALTEGGYARVVSLQQYPLSSFTISSWVNVTRFPEGIAPVITYLSEDVTSQLAFFLRPEGVGILWGGPSGQSAQAPTGELPLVDRHPRARWVAKKEKQREKREAVDYSGGLGDIQNILTKRSGTVGDNTWAPLNFVDVGEMGVADLMLSGSDPTQKVVANEEPNIYPKAYTDWTNVPFELTMEESIGDKQIHSKNEASPHRDAQIITSPTGNDDFVFFNWNSPKGKKTTNVPLETNNWSPVWQSTKQNLRLNQEDPSTIGGEKMLDTLTAPPKRKQTWEINYDSSSEAELSNKWGGVDLNANVYETRPFVTKLLPTKIERPIWPSPNMVPQDHRSTHNSNIAPTQENKDREDYKPQVPQMSSNFLEIAASQETRGKKVSSLNLLNSLTTQSPPEATMTTYFPVTIQATKKDTTTTQNPSPETRRSTLLPRRNINPTLYRYTKKRKDTSAPTKSSPKVKEPETQTASSRLVPLWEIIKKTQKDVNSEPSLPEQPQSKNPVYSIPAYSKSSYTSTQRPPHRTTKHSFPEPTLPPIKSSDNREPLQFAASVRKNAHYRSRPIQIPSIVRRPKTTTVRTTSTLPPTTSKRIAHRPTTLIQRVPNYQGYKPETSTEKIKPTTKRLTKVSSDQYKTSTTTTKGKHDRPALQTNKYAYRKFNEFEKTMQDPKLIKEGNTAIVYAVPITNEKEFYEMYKQYQRDSSTPSKSPMNLHDLYHKMRTGDMNNRFEMEEELDENGIKSTRVSLYERENFPEKYNIVRKSTVQTTSTTTTKRPEKTSAPPARSDVPIVAYDHLHHSDAKIRDNAQNPRVDGAQNSDKFDEYDHYEYSNTDYEPEYDYYGTNKSEGIIDKSHFPVQPELETVSSGSKDFVDTDSHTNNRQGDQTSLADLYRPKESTLITRPQRVPSKYQDQHTLYLDQLPPQYQKPKKQYDFDTTTPQNPSNKAPNEPFSSQPIYSFDPKDLWSQGLIPRPIHVVGSQEEADEWMRRHDPNVDKSPFLLSEGQETASTNINPLSLPPPLVLTDEQAIPEDEITQVAKPEALDPVKSPLDIHFEKAAYPFKENTWYHLALTWNARTRLATIYVNGERIGVINNVLEGDPHLKEGGLFLIGKTLLPDLSDFDESSQFVGEISDLNMWATELSPLTMDSVFQCKYDPMSPQPIEWRTTELKLYDEAAMTPSPPLCGLVT